MRTHLQESAGLRGTAPVQSPVPVAGGRIGPLSRAILGLFVVLLALGYLTHLLPRGAVAVQGRVAPAAQGH